MVKCITIKLSEHDFNNMMIFLNRTNDIHASEAQNFVKLMDQLKTQGQDYNKREMQEIVKEETKKEPEIKK